MSDLLGKAGDWVSAQRTKFLTRVVTYQRGLEQVQVPATNGATTFNIDDGYGGVQRWESRDYLVLAADLVLAGSPTAPQAHDKIIDGEQAYEVLAPGNEDVYRSSDPAGTTLRIHTKRVQ